MRALGALLLVFGTALLARPVGAQPDEAAQQEVQTDAGTEPPDAQAVEGGSSEACTEDPQQCSRKAFAEGVQAFQAGDWPTALARFQQAYQLRPHPAVGLNLALAEMRNGLYLEAAEHLKSIEQDPEASKRLKENAQRELENASRGIAVLELDVASDAKVVATVNGTPMSGEPPKVSLNPGSYDLEVRSGERLVLRRTVRLGVGERLRVAVEVAREVQVVVPTATATWKPPPPSEKLHPGWFLGGAGLTTLLGIATVWSGLDTQSAFDDYERDLPSLPQEEINQRVDDGNDKELRTNVLLGVTVLSAAGTTVLGVFLTDWGTPDDKKRASLTVGPGSLLVQGRF